MKKYFLGFAVMFLVFTLSGCGLRGVSGISDKSTSVKGDVGGDVCQEFSADFIFSATGKPIVKIEPDWLLPKVACRFYFTYDKDFYKGVENPILRAGGEHIFMMVEDRNVAKQNKASEILGLTVKSDPRIKMENWVHYRKDGSIWELVLVINPDRYLRMNYSKKAMTDDELIEFAAKVAQKLQGNVNFGIKTNPVVLQEETASAGASQQAVAETFLQKLVSKDIDGALKMLDMDIDTKQSWGVNFYNIESLKVNKIEEAFPEQWTAYSQVFKAELDAKVKPAGLNMGWVQGLNYRWITLKKNASGIWLVGEIANNP